MTRAEAIKMLTAKVECIKRYSSGINEDCNSPDCGECTLWYEQGNMGEQIEYLQMAIKALEESPERKIGRWVEVHGFCTPGGDPVWACSECGKGIHVYGIEHGTYGSDVSDGQWKACPNCGCRMEGETHD